MKILPDFTRLHTGENASRSLEIEISEKYRDKSVKLGFVSPLGRVLISDTLKLTAGKASYTLPAGLLDGKGQLLCQLLIYSGEEYMCKSPVLELPVYASVDDMTSPAVSGEGLKSLTLMWELLEGKAEKEHTHGEYYTAGTIDGLLDGKAEKNHSHDSYYTKAQTDIMLENKAGVSHLHSGVYLTREEIEAMLGGEGAIYEHNHDSLYYRRSELDSTNARLSSAEALLSSVNSTGLVYRRTLTSADDLDNITEAGVYVYSTSSRPANAPFENAAVVEVLGSNNSKSQRIQRAYRYGIAGYAAFRPYYDGKWGAWMQLATTDDVALSEYNTLVMLQDHNHDSSYAGKSTVDELSEQVSENTFFLGNIGDYVVDQGTIGKWSYRKWSSGYSEAWGTGSLELTKNAYDWGGGIYCASGYGALPSGVFTSVSGIQVTPIYWYYIGAAARVTAGLNIEANIFGRTSTVSSLEKGDTVEFNCWVRGAWK